ncbi:restriction endonuclease subunit S [Aquipseudomonas ullengensis]|uniref:Restriction endonuclease subunit S n=1 Tax=Aquipseudomonas ullengensis TaxID=2759166 RepID=A0A7W4QCQ4_9GAMM|nr:restriction endonuclease subunit S [Pseudomonas ullengensis]MBB2493698.1 restriction endonuclease subunit S [Pseudomonas ullengensis]
MTALLTDNLPLLAGAPNGIKKLRELILELAVRGKLVPQNPSDEPASELLKRIAEEKARLVAEGKLRKQKPLPEISEQEQLFELPPEWKWVRLGEIQTFTNGYAFKSHDFQEEGVGVIRIGDVKREGFISTDGMVRFPREKLSEIDSRYFVEPSELVISMTGDVKLAFNRSSESFLLNQRVGKITLHQVSAQYICMLLVTQAQEKIEQASGSVISNVSTEEINNSVVSLPPLAEQHRIVAKVDELMALCDRLEAQQAYAENAHAQLVQALLDSLTQASDATDFATNWQRLAEHFHTLFTTEPSIDALKQTLLQLAVMGKLVPQDPSDEPASELLKRIAEEKVRLFAEGKIKKQKAKAEVAEEEKPFELPDTWEWVRLGEILSLTSGKGFKAEEYSLHGARLFQIANVSLGHTKWEIENFLPENYLNEYPELVLKDGDVLIALNRPLLNGKMKVCIISEEDLPAILYQRVGRFSFYDSSVESKYFYYYLQSHLFIGKLNESLQGSDQPFINQSQVVEFLFSWPPLAEQHRIVAKVDQLMALCDQLKTHLTQARQLNEQLASTLVEQAVA